MDMTTFWMTAAKLIGEPINEQLRVPVAISEMADVDTAEPGEHVFYFATLDSDPDEIYYVNTSSGEMIAVTRSPVGDTELTFQHLNSRLEYVLVSAVMDSPDQKVLARKKEHIAMGMDKLEVKLILDAVIASSDVTTITPTSTEDLWDVIVRAKQAIEDYGDDFLLMVGSAVKNAMDTYVKDNASTFNYKVSLAEMLKVSGIKVRKIIGVVKTGNAAANKADSGSSSSVLDTNKFVLVARDSTISDGKPLHFVRRKISADIAKLMGADVDEAQRALVMVPTPVQVGGLNTLAYGVYGYESIIWAIKNRKGLIKSADLSSIL